MTRRDALRESRLDPEVARQLGKRFIFAEKMDDQLALRRGFKIGNGEPILVVEDVMTRGGRVRETLDICEKAYIVSEGQIIAEGEPDLILANQKARDVYLGQQFRF